MRLLMTMVMVLTLAATVSLAGCKKKEEAKKEAPAAGKAEKKAAPAEAPAVAPAEKPAEEPAAAAADFNIEESADVAESADAGEAVAAPGSADVAEEAPVEAPAEVATDVLAAPEEGTAPVEGDAAAEGVAPAEGAAPVEGSAGGDVAATEEPTGEEPTAEEAAALEAEAAANPHFGREFKLDAVMMVADVTKYPEHYSTFETIKLRGTVMAVKEDKVLLGHETVDGFYLICINMGDFARRELKVGQIIQFEGKMTKQDWALDEFGAVETGEKERGVAEGYALVVEAGETE